MSFVSADLPAGARARRFDTPDGPLAAVEVGPPDPRGTALLVPGFSGSKEDFGPLLPPLAADGWRVVALDQRGQHESPGPDDLRAYAVDALAADVLAVAAALGGPVHLLGHSFGGLVCRRAALLRPRALLSLTLLASGPEGLTGPRVDVLALLPQVLATGGTAAVADAAEALAAVDPAAPEVPDATRAFLRQRWLSSSATGLLGMAEGLRAEPDRVDALRATGLPVLVLHGEDDDAWSPALQGEMAVRLRAAHVVLPGARHSPAVEATGATAAALGAFWRQANPGSPSGSSGGRVPSSSGACSP